MFCPACGARNAPGSIACHQCGAILPGLTDALPPSTAAEVERQRQMSAHPPPQQAGGVLGGVETMTHAEPGPTAADPAPAQPVYPGRPAGNVPLPAPSSDGRLIGRVKLVVEQGKILGEQFLLSDREITVGRYDAGTGRCPDIDLTEQDPAYVHRQHVKLVFNDGGTDLTMYDLGGRNGSYVNNQLIDKNGSARVRLGDKVRVGRVVMRLQGAPELDEKNPRRG